MKKQIKKSTVKSLFGKLTNVVLGENEQIEVKGGNIIIEDEVTG